MLVTHFEILACQLELVEGDLVFEPGFGNISASSI